MQEANKTNVCEVFEMPQNPGGMVNVIFTCLCLENTRALSYLQLFGRGRAASSPLRASVHAVQIAVIGDVFV